MIVKEMTRSLLHLLLTAFVAVVTAESACAELVLQQKVVLGFPVDGVIEIAQIEPNAPGAHRLAVLHGSYLLGLQWSPQRNAYVQTFFVPLSFYLRGSYQNFGASHMIFADVNGDSRNDIVVFASYPAEGVAAYDSMTGALLKTFTLRERMDTSFGAIAQNIDDVPGDEMIVNDSGISAYAGDTPLWHSTVKASIMPASPAALAHGEVFLRTETEVIVLDARSGAERRRLPIACGVAAVGQSFDGSRLIACGTASGVQLFDGMTAAVRWNYPSDYRYGLRRVVMFDVDGDGVEDVLVRSEPDSYKESLQVLNGRNGTPRGTAKPLELGGAVIGIKDGCEPPQLAVIEGGGSTAPDALSLLDASTMGTKSVYAFDSYGTSGCAFADFNGDGRKELAVSHDGKMSTFSIEPAEPGETKSVGESPWSGSRGIAATQLDHAAPSKFIQATTCGAYLGCIEAWGTASQTPLWMAPLDEGEIPRCAVVADVDGDGAPDVLTGSVAVHSGAKGTFIYAFRGRDGMRLWSSVNIPRSTGRVCVADVEGKGEPQVLALSSTIGIVRLNRSKGTVSGFNEFSDGKAFATYQRNGDSKAKVVVATTDRLFILDDGQVKTELQGVDVAGITEIEVADIDGDGVPEILVAQHYPPSPLNDSIRLQVRAIDTLALLWASESFPLLLNFSQVEQISVDDVDNDGMPEVIFLSGLTARIFKTNAIPPAMTSAQFDAVAALSATSVVRSCCASVSLHWNHARPGTSPPLAYRIYRQDINSGHDVLLGTTSRNEFVDFSLAAGARYRYSVEVTDAAGHASALRLTSEVNVPQCHRTVGRR